MSPGTPLPAPAGVVHSCLHPNVLNVSTITYTIMRAMTTRRLVLAAAALVIGAAIGPSTASAGPIVYVAGTGGEFGTLDLATGDFTSIGTLNPSSGAEIVGMGFGPDGNLYGLDFIQPNSNLYPIGIT